MAEKKKKSQLVEEELLFHNSIEEFRKVSQNRLFISMLTKKVVKFKKDLKEFQREAGIPFEVTVHFKLGNKEKS